MLKTILALALVAAAFPLAASATPTASACPDTAAVSNRTLITGSPCTLDVSRAAIEAGYTNLTIDGKNNAVAYPQTQIRIGTYLPGLEADVNLPSVVKTPGAHGVADIGFGAKYAIFSDARFALAARAAVDLPTGVNGFGAFGTSLAGGLVGGYKASPAVRLGLAVNALSLAGGLAAYGAFGGSFGADVSVYHATHLTGGYALQSNALGSKTPSRSTYQFGVTQGIGTKALVDIEVGRDPKLVTGQDRYVSAGFSYRP